MAKSKKSAETASQEPTTASEWITLRIRLVQYTANQYVAPFHGLNKRSEDWQSGALQDLFDELVQEGCKFLLEREHTYNPEKLDFGNFCYTMIQYGMRSYLYQRFTKSSPEVRIPFEDEFDPHYDVEVDAIAIKQAIKQLCPRKQLVLIGYLSGERGFLSKFAKTEGISPQRASQIKEEAINEIKSLFES